MRQTLAIRTKVFLTAIVLCALWLPVSALAVDAARSALLEADTFDYDQVRQVFTATGHVRLEQDSQLVTADRMTYSKVDDTVYAEGNVVYIDKTGQTYFGNRFKLEQGMKKAAVEQIGIVFPDGSRFAARNGEQKDENTIVLRDGVYSPCNLCQDDPHKAPQWQLRANKIVHDKKDKDIYYHGVKLDAYGVPIAYLPYFSHPDPSVKARSGFLMSDFSTDTKKGFMVRNYYYKNFSPHEDMTLEVSPSQKMGTVVGAQYRRNFEKGYLLFNGSANQSTVRSNNGTIIKPEKLRGHVFADGYYRLNPDWGAGFNIRRTSDSYYLRDFNYEISDVLTNTAYVNRIKGRDYTDIRANYFQDLRPGITQEQPDILPWVKHNMVGAPNNMLGGRWNVDNEFVTLFRNGQQSVSRVSTVPGWERRDILPLGIQSVMNTKFRADGYWVRKNSPFDSTTLDPNLDKTVGRFTPSAQSVLSYPLVRPGKSVTALIEPKVAMTVAPNSANNDNIPNEDSRDVQVDISNLFEDNRFPGYDRVENGTQVSYGVKMGGWHNNGNSTFVTVGQSHRLTSNNPFPNGSGLEGRRSDLVGQVESTFYDRFYMDYRFQLDQEGLQDRRHELQAAYMDDDFEARGNYTFAEQIQGTGLPQNRQQLGFSAAKALSQKWAVAVDSITDLMGDGLLKAGSSLQYKNECLRLTFRAEKDLTDRLAGGSETRFMFSVGLRNLGGYDTPLLTNDPLYQAFGSGQTRL